MKLEETLVRLESEGHRTYDSNGSDQDGGSDVDYSRRSACKDSHMALGKRAELTKIPHGAHKVDHSPNVRKEYIHAFINIFLAVQTLPAT